MLEKEFEYPTIEEIKESIASNFNLKIIENEETKIVFEDEAVNFVNGFKEKFIARTSIDTEDIIDESSLSTGYGYIVEETLEILPLILRLGVDKICVEMNEDSEVESEIKDGVIKIHPLKIADNLVKLNRLALKETDDYIEFDKNLSEKIAEIVAKTMFENLEKNPLFFGEITTNEVDYKKYLV